MYCKFSRDQLDAIGTWFNQIVWHATMAGATYDNTMQVLSSTMPSTIRAVQTQYGNPGLTQVEADATRLIAECTQPTANQSSGTLQEAAAIAEQGARHVMQAIRDCGHKPYHTRHPHEVFYAVALAPPRYVPPPRPRLPPPPPDPPAMVISAAAWRIAKAALNGNVSAVNYMQNLKAARARGDQNAESVMAQIRIALKALGQNPAYFGAECPYSRQQLDSIAQWFNQIIWGASQSGASAAALWNNVIAGQMPQMLRSVSGKYGDPGLDPIASQVTRFSALQQEPNWTQSSNALSVLTTIAQAGLKETYRAIQQCGGRGASRQTPPESVIRQFAHSSAPQMAPQTPPHQVIAQGSDYLKKKAWAVSRGALNGNVNAVNYLTKERNAAHQGNWMSRQFLTYAQSFIQQMGGDVRQAKWSGESTGSLAEPMGESDFGLDRVSNPLRDEAIKLVNRARNRDQLAMAALSQLGPAARAGSLVAEQVHRYAMEYAHGGIAAVGAAKMAAVKKAVVAKATAKVVAKPATQRSVAFKPVKVAVKAPAKAAPKATSFKAGNYTASSMHANLSSSPSKLAMSPTSATATPLPASAISPIPTVAAQQIASYAANAPGSFPNYNTGGGGGGGGSDNSGSSGGDSSGGGSSDDGSSDPTDDSSTPQDTNGDMGLDPSTGHVRHVEAANLIAASRAGDKDATASIRAVVRAAQAGDPRATRLAKEIAWYTQKRPDVPSEIIEGRAVHLSHGHPLTAKKVDAIASTFGAEEETFKHFVKNPHGPAQEHRPAFLGQIVGRAQKYQAARFPGAPAAMFSPKAAQEHHNPVGTPQQRNEQQGNFTYDPEPTYFRPHWDAKRRG